jgi:hypothetical protein
MKSRMSMAIGKLWSITQMAPARSLNNANTHLLPHRIAERRVQTLVLTIFASWDILMLRRWKLSINIRET